MSQRKSVVMATAPTTAITPLGPILPIHVSSHSPHCHRHHPPHTPHCPPSPTPHPDSPAPHTHTPLIHFMLLTSIPSTLAHRSPREIFHVGLLTPSPHFAHPHPPPHTLSHTSACLLALHTLHSLPRHTGLPSHRDPGFLTLSVHTASHKFHTEGSHLCPLPSRNFPLTAISLHCLSPLWVP